MLILRPRWRQKNAKNHHMGIKSAFMSWRTFKSAPAQKVLSTKDLKITTRASECFNEAIEDSNWERKFFPIAFLTLGRFIEMTAIPSSAPVNLSTLTSTLSDELKIISMCQLRKWEFKLEKQKIKTYRCRRAVTALNRDLKYRWNDKVSKKKYVKVEWQNIGIEWGVEIRTFDLFVFCLLMQVTALDEVKDWRRDPNMTFSRDGDVALIPIQRQLIFANSEHLLTC